MEADLYGLDEPPSTPHQNIVLDPKNYLCDISHITHTAFSSNFNTEPPAFNPPSSTSALASASSEPPVILMSISAPESVHINLNVMPFSALSFSEPALSSFILLIPFSAARKLFHDLYLTLPPVTC